MSAAAPNPRRILFVMCLALAAVVSAVASLNVALPELARDTRADQTELQWIVDAYALSFAALLLPAGALGDRYGRRLLLYLGLAVFGVGSLVATQLSDPTSLIAARAVLGVGAAMVMPATLSILTSLTPADHRDHAVALWAAVAGASAILGLLAAGLLLEAFSWSSIFALNAGLATLAIAATARWVPESREPQEGRLDVVGALLAAGGLGAVVYGIIEAPNQGWTAGSTLTVAALGLLCLLAFCAWELRQRAPLIDIRLFAKPGFSAGTLSIGIQFFCFFGFVFLVLQQLQLVRDMSPLLAAVSMLPMAAALMGVSRRVPRITERFGTRATATTGLLLMAGGLAVIAAAGSESSYWWMAAGLVVLGAGMALATTPATTAILAALPSHQQGVGSAMNDTAREVGGALGIAVLGSLLSDGYRSGLGEVGAALPPAAREAVGESLGAALQVGEKLSIPGLADAAQAAFMDGFSTAIWAAVGTLAVAAVVINVLLARARARAAAATRSGDAAVKPAEVYP